VRLAVIFRSLAAERVDLFGGPQPHYHRDPNALKLIVLAPQQEAFVPALRIRGRGLI
jgi:alpha-L-fucosidase